MDNLGKRSRFLLEKAQLTLKDLMRECSVWLLESIHQVKPSDIPDKPNSVMEYEILPEDTRNNLTDSYFKDHPDIRQYYYFVRKATFENQDWVKKLLEFKSSLPEDDVSGRRVYMSKIQQFVGKLRYIYEQTGRGKLSPEERQLLQEFGGKVVRNEG